MHVLVTGASGFVGRHVLAALVARGHTFEGWSRNPPPGSGLLRADLLEPASFAARRGPWDAALHLAAHAIPSAPWTAAMLHENARGAQSLLEHVARHAPGARFVLASSGAVYAHGPGLRREDERLEPRGLYGESKRRSEQLAAAHAGQLDLRVARLFNQIGPGMPAGLAVSDLCARLARREDPLRMQGTDALRDFVDVRDGAEAVVLLCEAPLGGTWNVSSGRGRRLSELAQGLCCALGRSTRIEFAPAPVDELVGSGEKLARELDWRPRIPFEQTLELLAREIRARDA